MLPDKSGEDAAATTGGYSVRTSIEPNVELCDGDQREKTL